jgi:hypothetical protein
MMFSPSNELVVPASVRKLVAIAAGSVAFALAGAWLVRNPDNLTDVLAGAAAIVLFGACGIVVIVRIVRPTPAVVINDKGILDNASALGAGFIAWDEIADLREYRFNSQVFLGIFPKQLDAILARQSAWKRQAIRANLALGAAPINIPQVVLPITVTELLREIRRRFRAPERTRT